jgi:hypothetical protein
MVFDSVCELNRCDFSQAEAATSTAPQKFTPYMGVVLDGIELP